MRFEIVHSTKYVYAQPVLFDLHWLRVQPRSGGDQRLEEFSLEVHPTPAGITNCLDADGNAAAICYVRERHDRLEFTSRSVVTTLRENPFDYQLDPRATSLPLAYNEAEAAVLAPARARALAEGSPGDAVAEFAKEIATRAGGRAVEFLTRLNDEIHARCRIVRREQGPPLTPEATLSGREGACRDLAVLFIDAARAQGMAARFVSGYFDGDDEHDRDLHAWAEVYVPGGGWRGYDPTTALAAADQHVAIASAIAPAGAAPITGIYYGPAVDANMHADVSIRRLPDTSASQQQHQHQ